MDFHISNRINYYMGIISLILGILGILGFLGLIGINFGLISKIKFFIGPLSILAIIFGVYSRKIAIESNQITIMATTGLLLGIIVISLTVIFIVIFTSILGLTLFGVTIDWLINK